MATQAISLPSPAIPATTGRRARSLRDGWSLGVSWGAPSASQIVVLFVLTLIGSSLAPALTQAPAGPEVSVIVREAPGTMDGPERAILALGGTVDRRLPIINGFQATIRTDRIAQLQRQAGIVEITRNSSIHLNMLGDGYNATTNMGSMNNITKAIGAQWMWMHGITGAGVDVALVDTGVNPEPELVGRLINGPDLSFDSQSSKRRYLDGYGHGTHMAGIIAGNDARMPLGGSYTDPDFFDGVAPDSRIVNVKAANRQGLTDVSMVIAALDWIVQHRQDENVAGGLNIRVINLSFGTDGVQNYVLDPLAYAVERAWRAGIVVVVSAGNAGYGTAKMDNPAYDPFVIAVGASQFNSTLDPSDDTVPDFSSRGNSYRRPDLVAPGKSVISLRAPGSYIDDRNPEARLGTQYFKGSGTSQAAAVVSGAAALLLQDRPNLTPDQVKRLLVANADDMPAADVGKGAGRVNVHTADDASTPVGFVQDFTKATGLGSIALARGSAIIEDQYGVPLLGDIDIFGRTYNVATSGSSWSNGWWNGNAWSGNSWSGNSWSGRLWSGNSWSGNSWSDGAWLGNSWSGNSWSGCVWSSANYD